MRTVKVKMTGYKKTLKRVKKLNKEMKQLSKTAKELAELEEKDMAIDCAVRHIRALHHQCVEHREADSGEPCSQCQYMSKCNCDVLNTLEPLLRHTTEDFILAAKKELNDKTGR